MVNLSEKNSQSLQMPSRELEPLLPLEIPSIIEVLRVTATITIARLLHTKRSWLSVQLDVDKLAYITKSQEIHLQR
jgi:hypothetical protein